MAKDNLHVPASDSDLSHLSPEIRKLVTGDFAKSLNAAASMENDANFMDYLKDPAGFARAHGGVKDSAKLNASTKEEEDGVIIFKDGTYLRVKDERGRESISTGKLAKGEENISAADLARKLDKRDNEIEAMLHNPEVGSSLSAGEGRHAPTSKDDRALTIEEQKRLKAAGYGDILTAHGEKHGGVDGARGGDTRAAEAKFREDHGLGKNEDITAALREATKDLPIMAAADVDHHGTPTGGAKPKGGKSLGA